MSSYGFKLFGLDLVLRDGRTPQPWSYDLPDKGGTVLRLDHIETVLRKHVGSHERGLPLAPDSAPLTPAQKKQQPVFRIESVDRVGTHCLFIELRYGRHKDEDKGLPATDAVLAEVDLTDIAPTRSYRIGIMAGSTGTKGMMVVEAVSGACPSRYFMKWMRRWVLDEATNAAGIVADNWYKLVAKPAMDPALLRRYVINSSPAHVVLIQRGVANSRNRSDERFRMEVGVFANQSDEVMKLATTAISAADTEEDSDKEYAAALAEILGKTDISELDLDDGWVVVDTASGKQQISPSRIPEVFVYPVANFQPTPTAFRQESSKEIVRIRKSVGATLDLSGW